MVTVFSPPRMVLAIMMFPYIISISREALIQVPREQREAALALGATRWEATWDAVVPFARLGIVGSIFLSLARALGETMAVTMVIGNDPKIHASMLAPGYTIAAGYRQRIHRSYQRHASRRPGGAGAGVVPDHHDLQRSGATACC